MNKLLLVVAMALVQNKKVLFQQRTSEKTMPQLWELPGGKMKNKETAEEAVIREIFEEIGVCVHPNDLLPLTFVSYVYPNFNLLMPVYLCKKWEGVIQSQENQKIKFLGITDLDKINMLEADRLLIPALKAVMI